jgi:hypothetical protein
MFCWDSTDQSNMPEIESLDHADLRAKNAFSKYFKQLLCRVAYAQICAKEHETPMVHSPIKHEQVEAVKESKSTPVEDESHIDSTQYTTIGSEIAQDQVQHDDKTGSDGVNDSNNDKNSEVEEVKEIITDGILEKGIEDSKEENKDISEAIVEEREDMKPTEITHKSDSDELIVVKDMKNYSGVLNLLKEYNLKFVKEWSRTYNFHKWKHEHHESCAFLESGRTGSKSEEFYKENVSLKNDI